MASSAAPLTLLVGDSGTGKSAALSALQEHSPGLAPDPIKVDRAPASLQLALLDALGAAVALIAEDEPSVRRIGKLIVDAVDRLADSRLQDLRAEVGRQLLAVVRARVSDELADLVEGFAESISKSRSDALAERIARAGDAAVVDQIVSFAAEVETLADGELVYLALDDLDRLDGGDLRRLGDLIDRLPPRLRIRGSFTTWDSQTREDSRYLGIEGAQYVPIGGLTEDQVSMWLQSRGLPSGLLDAVMVATNGYPVHVEDAVQLLVASPTASTLRALKPNTVLKARAEQAWSELDTYAQVAVARLAFYVDRPAPSRIRELLGIDQMTWGTLEIALIHSGLLVEGRPTWFHELRRQVIWESVLSEDMRIDAVEAATADLAHQLALPAARAELFIGFARAAADNVRLQQAEPSVEAAVAATTDEVAVAAAALELIEFMRGDQVIDAEIVLTHARQVFGLQGDAIDALDRLAQSGLVYVASDDRASVLALQLGTNDAARVIAGRAANECGRMPVVQLATAAFETRLRPLLSPFDGVVYGVGRPRMAFLAAQVVAEVHRRKRDGVVHHRREEPSLILRAAHGDVPIYAAVAYDTTDERNEALLRCEGFEGELWGEALVVDEIVELPSDVVPSYRFCGALDWLTRGRTKADAHRGAANDSPMELSVELEIRSRLRAAMRDESAQIERFAFGLEDTSGYAYSEVEGEQCIIEIGGGDAATDMGVRWNEVSRQPFMRLRIAEELELPRDQHIRRIEWRSGARSTDVVRDEVGETQKHASAFNRHQRKLNVDFEETTLRGLLRAALEQRELDGRRLVEATPLTGLTLPPPTKTYVLLELDEPTDDGWVPGARDVVYAAAFLSDHRDRGVEFSMIRSAQWASSPSQSPRDLMEHHFGVDTSEAVSHSWGEAAGGLARLLGFEFGEVRFQY